MINPINPLLNLQAPTESTPIPPKPPPYTVQDLVSLSGNRDKEDTDDNP
jgi:hypothetical protein